MGPDAGNGRDCEEGYCNGKRIWWKICRWIGSGFSKFVFWEYVNGHCFMIVLNHQSACLIEVTMNWILCAKMEQGQGYSPWDLCHTGIHGLNMAAVCKAERNLWKVIWSAEVLSSIRRISSILYLRWVELWDRQIIYVQKTYMFI